ncbi:uncharacterized protein LOC143291127 isoform X2 [Babylonia areolata]|uniref:uncharacterized protein LOC143291127 isoform X2 n=1 Tax=Babylonia areolata TaxID=304850 RepID=UPI003FCF85D4
MAQAGVPHQPGLYIGGLRHDLHPAKLATLIVSLLSKFQVQVAKRFVHITFKASEAFAIVELPDIKVSRNLLAQLSSTDNVLNVFDLSKITFHPSEFRVGPNLSQSPKYRSRSRSRPNRKNDTPVVDSTSCTTNHSSSSHSYGYGRRNRSSSNRRNRNRKKKCSGFSEATTSQSSSSHCDLQKPYKGIQRSRKSLQEADDDSSQSESDTDSSALSRDASSCSGVSGELEGKVDSSRRNFPLPDARPRAGGVQRLAQEFNVDPVSRSVSDRGIQPPVSKTSTTTSTTGLPLPSRVSVTTSTPGAGNGLVTNFYRVGQAIGRETRHSEFKQGGRLKDRAWLIDTVGKYVCGFLNSAEGGTLYIGVSDKGVVTGISCPQSKEDDYRLLIDDALKGIDPPLFTHAYTVRFVPLMESSGHMSECLQVLEVEVKEIPSLDQLYVFRGNAYLRRDGSLQGPLKARQVQEWTRKRLEMDGTSGTLRWQLQLTTSQLEKEREKTARMEEKVSELEGYISEVKLEHKKSKICAVM